MDGGQDQKMMTLEAEQDDASLVVCPVEGRTRWWIVRDAQPVQLSRWQMMDEMSD